MTAACSGFRWHMPEPWFRAHPRSCSRLHGTRERSVRHGNMAHHRTHQRSDATGASCEVWSQSVAAAPVRAASSQWRATCAGCYSLGSSAMRSLSTHCRSRPSASCASRAARRSPTRSASASSAFRAAAIRSRGASPTGHESDTTRDDPWPSGGFRRALPRCHPLEASSRSHRLPANPPSPWAVRTP